MDAKEFLSQPKKIDLRIKNRLFERQQLKDIALGITANMEGERVQSSGSKSKMADALNKLVDAEADIDTLVDKLIGTKKEVTEVIEELPSALQSDVLFKVYIQNLSFQEVADIYCKSYDSIKKVHKRAVRNVQAILDQQ